MGEKELPRNVVSDTFEMISSSINGSEGIASPEMCNRKLSTVEDELAA